ncbi:hypothetical protein OAL71_02280, partial [Phycisphaerales bacterium]|nr:hypothetical protein [Phycisphaerales bacterium]
MNRHDTRFSVLRVVLVSSGVLVGCASDDAIVKEPAPSPEVMVTVGGVDRSKMEISQAEEEVEMPDSIVTPEVNAESEEIDPPDILNEASPADPASVP